MCFAPYKVPQGRASVGDTRCPRPAHHTKPSASRNPISTSTILVRPRNTRYRWRACTPDVSRPPANSVPSRGHRFSSTISGPAIFGKTGPVTLQDRPIPQNRTLQPTKPKRKQDEPARTVEETVKPRGETEPVEPIWTGVQAENVGSILREYPVHPKRPANAPSVSSLTHGMLTWVVRHLACPRIDCQPMDVQSIKPISAGV